jgi:hypothetical protein
LATISRSKTLDLNAVRTNEFVKGNGARRAVTSKHGIINVCVPQASNLHTEARARRIVDCFCQLSAIDANDLARVHDNWSTACCAVNPTINTKIRERDHDAVAILSGLENPTWIQFSMKVKGSAIC